MSAKGTFLITLSPSGKTFEAAPHSSLLASGLSAGMTLPFRCNNGSCGDCRARVISGEVEAIQFHDYVLTSAEKASGVILMCSHRPLGNVEIEVSEAYCAEDIPVQQLNSRICHRETIDDVLIVRLKISRGKALWYLAGQYATLHLPDSTQCRLPIASCPCETGFVEFHLPPYMHHERGVMEQLSKRDRLLVEGPYGDFTINDAALASHHHVFITADQSFSVVKPMIEHIIATEIDPPCTLLRLAAAPYKNNLCRSWSDAFDWFSYQSLPDFQSLSNSLPALNIGAQALKFYISASPATQQEIRKRLEETGVHDPIVLDSLAGSFSEQI